MASYNFFSVYFLKGDHSVTYLNTHIKGENCTKSALKHERNSMTTITKGSMHCVVERANIVTHGMSMNVLEFVPSVSIFRKHATIEFETFI